jgi:hypothetical protein
MYTMEVQRQLPIKHAWLLGPQLRRRRSRRATGGESQPHTSAREELGIANPSNNDQQTVEPRFRDNLFG